MKAGSLPPRRLTRRGRVVRAVAIAVGCVAAFAFGARTADACWYGPCGPTDPVPSLGPAWSTTCPTTSCGGTP